MTFWQYVWQFIIILNTLIAFYIVFRRPRSIATTLAWLLVLLIFPIGGFIVYSFFGRGLAQENLFAINTQKHIGLQNVQDRIPQVDRKSVV